MPKPVPPATPKARPAGSAGAKPLPLGPTPSAAPLSRDDDTPDPAPGHPAFSRGLIAVACCLVLVTGGVAVALLLRSPTPPAPAISEARTPEPAPPGPNVEARRGVVDGAPVLPPRPPVPPAEFPPAPGLTPEKLKSLARKYAAVTGTEMMNKVTGAGGLGVKLVGEPEYDAFEKELIFEMDVTFSGPPGGTTLFEVRGTLTVKEDGKTPRFATTKMNEAYAKYFNPPPPPPPSPDLTPGQQTAARRYADQAGMKVMNSLGGGQDFSTTVRDGDVKYDPVAKEFLIEMGVTFNGKYFRNNQYALNGALKVNEDGTNPRFGITYMNDRLTKTIRDQKWLEIGAVAGMALYMNSKKR